LKLKNIGEGIEGAAFITFALLTPFLRPRRSRWGATDAEVKKKLPGDELMPHPKWGYTHAVTLKAPVAEVWPWIVQMGQGRGGFYSYEFLENLVGCDIHNADRIIPEFQQLKVGDEIKLAAKSPGLPVAVVEPNHALVLHVKAKTLITGGAKYEEATPQKYFSTNWLWVLKKIDERTTRLISRFLMDYSPGLGNRLTYGTCLVEPISFVMSRKMLLEIKKRAESLAQKNLKN
jgi:hypothetical protein